MGRLATRFLTQGSCFDLQQARIYNGLSGPWVRLRREGAAGTVPSCGFAIIFYQGDGMLGKAVKIRHCPATVSARSCVCDGDAGKAGKASLEPQASGRRFGFVLRPMLKIRASQETDPVCRVCPFDKPHHRVPRGTEDIMTFLPRPAGRLLSKSRLLSAVELPASAFLLFLAFATALHAVSVHGTVTDPLGYPIANATVALVQNGEVLVNGRTGPDGGYTLDSAASGRFYVLATGNSFRQLATQSFYGGRFDGVEQNVVLEPEWVRESIVVTATGVPQPQAQVSGAVSELPATDFPNRADLVDPLRQIPGVNVVQTRKRGG
jgi:hypothetical protein